jgi:hypothetical protein
MFQNRNPEHPTQVPQGEASPMLRSTHLIRALLVTMLLSLTSSAQKLDTKSLKDILSKQGFTGLLEGKFTFTLLGNMKCNSTMLQVYYYTWEESHPPGRAIHASYRLIFIEDRNYVGQYVVSDRPVLVKPDSLRFPVSEEDGNSFKCDEEGLPKSFYLDGGDRVPSR